MYHALAPYYDQIYPHEEFVTAFKGAVAAIRLHLGEQHQCRILDLCCGTGRALRLFADQATAELYGVDTDDTMLKLAAMNFGDRHHRPKFYRMDVRDLHPDDFDVINFDLVMMTGASLLHFSPSERQGILGFVAQVLRSGGLFIFDTLNSGTSFEANSKESKIRRSFVADAQRVVVAYIRHYDVDCAHHHSLVIKLPLRADGEKDEEPQLEYDYVPFYPLTPDKARSEATHVGLQDFGSLEVNYSHSTFLCMVKP